MKTKPKTAGASAAPKATPYRRSRSQHKTEAAEDYTELVFELILRSGQARTCDVAAELGVSHVTALRTIRRLQEEGYLRTEPHQPVFLTARGRRLALFARRRHKILLQLFLYLGIPSEIAAADVEGMEHHVSPISLRRIRAFLRSHGAGAG